MSRSASGKTWTELSAYESAELVEHFVRERKGEKLEPGKAHEIAAQFSQGREYFRSAPDASELVRPLILYYGVLALARGAVLFRHAGRRAPATSHGLSARSSDWDSLTSNPEVVPKLAIKIQKDGTFPKLAHATGNVEQCMVPNNDLPGMVSANSTGTEISGTTNLTIKEILSQIPEVADLYELTFEEHSRRLRCEILVTGAPEPDWKDRAARKEIAADLEARRHAFLGIVRTRAGLPSREWVAEHLGERASLKETGSNLLQFARDPRHRIGQGHLFDLYYDAGSIETPRQEMPVTTLASGEEYLKLPTENGILISTLLALHLAAFATSTLVRYHPSYWAMLIGRAQGDSIAPIMSATMSAVEERYPTLILDTLGGR